MAGRRGEHTTPLRGPTERITITLVPKAGSQLQERTNLAKTDLANRAIASHEFIDAQLRAGCDPMAHHNGTGATRIARYL